MNAINNDASIPTRGKLVAPSLQGTWTLQSVFDTGFLTSYSSAISILSVEQYPDNNCAAAFPDAGFGDPVNPQDVFPNYLTHTAGKNLIAQYLPSIPTAQQAGKQFMMFETNTASCGGFPGFSDSFGSALWAVDYGLQMAYSNFTGALLHIGGQDVSYNVSISSRYMLMWTNAHVCAPPRPHASVYAPCCHSLSPLLPRTSRQRTGGPSGQSCTRRSCSLRRWARRTPRR